MSQTIVGLDIGHYSIKAIRLDVSYRGFRALGFDEEILEDINNLEKDFRKLQQNDLNEMAFLR